MKKLFVFILAMSILYVPSSAAEPWKDLLVTRLMKLMTSNPTYTDVALTDIDKNGVPEAFLIRNGMNGGIKTGITLQNGTLVSIEVPNNVTGACLKDITVYDAYGEDVYVGKEIARYTAEILYFELELKNNKLSCRQVMKNDYADFAAKPYKDVFGDDFYIDGYPDRTKIEKFISVYNSPTYFDMETVTSKISVDGKIVALLGINVNDNNYFKVRDVAMILNSSANKFSVSWDQANGAISITTGKKYTIVGGELGNYLDLTKSEISSEQAKLVVDGSVKTLNAYNINGSNYFKIRDLGNIIGFQVGWDSNAGTITIENE